ncbi:nucleoside diphosphate kinase regulator [Candidatus Sumerlaeota bacterium]|nr:nucleoside diphosphate kinase regulator [Candidatus Sumerlaeota bacterium]
MRDATIYITRNDLKRLEEMLATPRRFGSRSRSEIQSLAAELNRGQIVDPREIPPNVVTMNSRVQLRDIDTNEEIVYSLAFPDEANIDEGKISVVSPIGTAILGYREGDEIEWDVPAGKRRIKIEKILYQPEASGDYHI